MTSFCKKKWIAIILKEIHDYLPVTKLRNLSDVHAMLLGAVENDFQIFIQKESYKIASD